MVSWRKEKNVITKIIRKRKNTYNNVLYLLKTKIHVSGLSQFKPILFKGRLYSSPRTPVFVGYTRKSGHCGQNCWGCIHRKMWNVKHIWVEDQKCHNYFIPTHFLATNSVASSLSREYFLVLLHLSVSFLYYLPLRMFFLLFCRSFLPTGQFCVKIKKYFDWMMKSKCLDHLPRSWSSELKTITLRHTRYPVTVLSFWNTIKFS